MAGENGDVKSRNSDARLLLCTMAYACFFTAAERSLRDALSIYEGLGFSEFSSIALPTIFLIVAMMVVAIISFIKKVEHFRPLYGMIGSALLAAGYASILYMHGVQPNSFLLVCSAAFFGVGSSMGFLALLEELSLDRGRAILIILSASVLSSAISLTINSLASVNDIAWICILLSTLSAICFLVLPLSRGCGVRDDSVADVDVGRGGQDGAASFRSLLSCMWQPALCVGALAFMSSIARSLVGKDYVNETIAVTFIGAIAACFLLFVFFSAPLHEGPLSKHIPQEGDIVSIYKLLFPLNAFLFLLLAFFGDGYVLFLAGVAEVSTTICHILMWIQAIAFGKKLGIPPFVVLGFFSGTVYFLLFWGYPVVYLGSAFFGYAFRAIIAVIAVYVMAMVLFTCLKAGSFLRSRNHMTNDAASRDGTIASSGAIPIEEERLKDICGDRYHLSSRELQVLGMLVRGRDVPYIADTLVLSRNTVKTHIKNIYVKLDVHSRQELLDKCEDLINMSI